MSAAYVKGMGTLFYLILFFAGVVLAPWVWLAVLYIGGVCK